MEEGLWTASCTSFAHSREQGHMDNTAAAPSPPGKSSHPHQKPGKIHPKPTGGDFKARAFGGHTSTVGSELGERTGEGWQGASEWRNLVFLIYFASLKVIQGRRHNPGVLCNRDQARETFLHGMSWKKTHGMCNAQTHVLR